VLFELDVVEGLIQLRNLFKQRAKMLCIIGEEEFIPNMLPVWLTEGDNGNSIIPSLACWSKFEKCPICTSKSTVSWYGDLLVKQKRWTPRLWTMNSNFSLILSRQSWIWSPLGSLICHKSRLYQLYSGCAYKIINTLICTTIIYCFCNALKSQNKNLNE